MYKTLGNIHTTQHKPKQTHPYPHTTQHNLLQHKQKELCQVIEVPLWQCGKQLRQGWGQGEQGGRVWEGGGDRDRHWGGIGGAAGVGGWVCGCGWGWVATSESPEDDLSHTGIKVEAALKEVFIEKPGISADFRLVEFLGTGQRGLSQMEVGWWWWSNWDSVGVWGWWCVMGDEWVLQYGCWDISVTFRIQWWWKHRPRNRRLFSTSYTFRLLPLKKPKGETPVFPSPLASSVWMLLRGKEEWVVSDGWMTYGWHVLGSLKTVFFTVEKEKKLNNYVVFWNKRTPSKHLEMGLSAALRPLTQYHTAYFFCLGHVAPVGYFLSRAWLSAQAQAFICSSNKRKTHL